jgi:arsenite methyltransferase
VYREAFRVLKSGGRLAISDVVAIRRIPNTVKRDFEKHSGCVSGAATAAELERMMRSAGFRDIHVIPKEESAVFIKDWFPGSGVERYVRSADVRAVKPRIQKR